MSPLAPAALLVRLLGLPAARQSLSVTAARLGISAPPVGPVLRASTLRLVWTIAPRITPFDLEAYLAHHFTKVGDQTRELLAQLEADREEQRVDTSALRSLSAKLEALDAGRG